MNLTNVAFLRLLVLPYTLLCLSTFCENVLADTSSNFTVNDLTYVEIEELMNIRVTSVSKSEKRLANAAAAIYIITADDIRRSGVTSIPEALRLAPGVQVARIDANKWAVSIRGFNGRFANKLLVLMDGRSIYSPLFSGVFWEAQDTVLEDIDRIEVIRGPGASLWGANAVNGVINIITKSAEDTHGGLISAGGGTQERGFGTARFGARLSPDSHLRLYAKRQDRANFVDASGQAAHDAWNSTQGGFRFDAKTTASDTITLQGDYYDIGLDETYITYRLPTLLDPAMSRLEKTRSDHSGGNLLSRWQRKLSDSDDVSLQLYYDHSEWNKLIGSEQRDTVDLDFQHHLVAGRRQEIVWGVGYRFSQGETGQASVVTFEPSKKREHLFSAFLHDELSLVPGRLALILGSRFEHNDYSGFEVQPTGRLLWTPNEKNTFWASVSRAVRTPSRGDQDLRMRYRTLSPPELLQSLQTSVPPGQLQLILQQFPPGMFPAGLVTISGSREFQAEELMAYELGYRTEPAHHVNLDLAAFYNDYQHLRAINPEQPAFQPPSFILPFRMSNDMHGYTYGAELAMTWSPLYWWRLQASYSYLRIVMALDADSTAVVNKADEGGSPRRQFNIRSGLNIWQDVTLDLWLRGASELVLPGTDFVSEIHIPAYVTMDARIAWKPQKSLELSLVGQNLLHDRQQEFDPDFSSTIPSEVGRSVYGKVTWLF